MKRFDYSAMNEEERAAFHARRARDLKRMTAPALWERWVDLLEQGHDIKVQRIRERLEAALRATGELREDAIMEFSAMGAGHDPEKMAQGRSGSGTAFRVFSQPVLDAFLALGGDS